MLTTDFYLLITYYVKDLPERGYAHEIPTRTERQSRRPAARRAQQDDHRQGARARRAGLVWGVSRDFAGATHLFSFIGFFVRSQSPFLRPDAPFAHGGARRGRQGWPSHQPFRMLRPGQAMP